MRSRRGSRCFHLLWLYLICVMACPLSAATAAPSVAHASWLGQPELAQPSDNMPIGPMANKRVGFSGEEGSGYSMLLTSKTSTLLAEAMHMLNRVKSRKERRWMESFIHKLNSLAAMLKEGPANSTMNQQEMENSISIIPNLDPKLLSVPNPIPITAMRKSMMIPLSAVATQKNAVIFNNQTISNLLNDEIATPDELVRQLEDAAKDHHHPRTDEHYSTTIHQVPLALEKTSISPPATPAPIQHKEDIFRYNKEKEKAYILTSLAKDVARFRRLGGTRQDIMQVFNFNNKFIDFTEPKFIPDKRHNVNNKQNQFEIAEINQIDGEGTDRRRASATKNELSISRSNEDFRHQARRNMHLQAPSNQHSMPRFHERPHAYDPHQPQNRPPQHHNHFRNVPQRRHQWDGVQYANQERRPEFMGYQPQGQYDIHRITGREGPPHRFPAYPDTNYNFNPRGRPEQKMRPFAYGRPDEPPRNVTLQGLPPYPRSYYQPPYSEEMKRQLRDGKIVVLSDSLVHANFRADGNSSNPVAAREAEN